MGDLCSSCGAPVLGGSADCPECRPQEYRTKSGAVLTDAHIQALSDLAYAEHQRDRLLDAAARALERTQVADDPSGAADEATAILEGVVTLSGEYVEP